ncbi:MAG: tripartite tricarboxylate transporter permease [Candidatus Rokubacteria bacterium]|nr:tripartite tricarboxylate transporter permease [Candidatus Rokubacteria bacterium]
MEVFDNLLYGFKVATTPVNLLYCFFGVFLGTLVGVLPGLGTVTGVAILIPLTFGMNPTTAMIMLAGIYYGAQYGGSTTAILLNLPGESTSIMTCLDGYQMARQGRAGPALGMAAFASFIAGTFSVLMLMLVAKPLVTVALGFGPAEYTALMILALSTIGGLLGESVVKGLIAAALGLMLGTVGTDAMTGVARYTYGAPKLLDGVSFLAVTVGLFGVAEVLENAERSLRQEVYAGKIKGLLPKFSDWAQAKLAILRGSCIGFAVGMLPGAGATAASMLAYLAEKKASRQPERFGKGAIEGVAAPEAANNAAAGGALVPLLTLGIPGSGTTAVMLGALMLYGLRPGPQLLEKNPDLVWGLIASMYIGNAMLLLLNLPLIGLWVRIIQIPYPILFPLILFFSFVGTYAVDNDIFDVYVMLAAGVLGYVLRKLRFPEAPVILGLVLGPMLEDQMRRALTLSLGDVTVFVTRPVSATLFALALVYWLLPALNWLRARRSYFAIRQR